MNFVNYILQNPIYTLLFGSGGILIVIIPIIQLVKKRRKNSNQQPEKTLNHPHPRNPYENSNTSVYDEEKSNSAFDDERQNAVSFASELIYNSPVEDKITLKQVDINKNEFNKK